MKSGDKKMILETFRRGTEIHPPLPTMAEIGRIVPGSTVALGKKRSCGFDRVDVRVWAVFKDHFTGTVIATGEDWIFKPENILEITEP